MSGSRSVEFATHRADRYVLRRDTGIEEGEGAGGRVPEGLEELHLVSARWIILLPATAAGEDEEYR